MAVEITILGVVVSGRPFEVKFKPDIERTGTVKMKVGGTQRSFRLSGQGPKTSHGGIVLPTYGPTLTIDDWGITTAGTPVVVYFDQWSSPPKNAVVT